MEATDTPDEETKMTNPDMITLKMIEALLAAIDMDDEDDAKAAVRRIRALLGDK